MPRRTPGHGGSMIGLHPANERPCYCAVSRMRFKNVLSNRCFIYGYFNNDPIRLIIRIGCKFSCFVFYQLESKTEIQYFPSQVEDCGFCHNFSWYTTRPTIQMRIHRHRHLILPGRIMYIYCLYLYQVILLPTATTLPDSMKAQPLPNRYITRYASA